MVRPLSLFAPVYKLLYADIRLCYHGRTISVLGDVTNVGKVQKVN